MEKGRVISAEKSLTMNSKNNFNFRSGLGFFAKGAEKSMGEIERGGWGGGAKLGKLGGKKGRMVKGEGKNDGGGR